MHGYVSSKKPIRQNGEYFSVCKNIEFYLNRDYVNRNQKYFAEAKILGDVIKMGSEYYTNRLQITRVFSTYNELLQHKLKQMQ
jgi:hypothetical protein